MRANRLQTIALVLCAAVLLCAGARAQAPVEPNHEDYCTDFAAQLLAENNPGSSVFLRANFLRLVPEIGCFLQANQSNRAALEVIRPARASVWSAFQSLSQSEQQGASVSSGASTNAVSKPSGPTAIAEEFAGASASSTTSSLTLQWAPGSLLTNMALYGVVPLCVNGIPGSCIQEQTIQRLNPLTFKITTTTSGGSKPLTGTAASSGSASPAQPVTVSSSGTSGPSFSGLTVQYALYGSKAQAAVKAAGTLAGSSTAPAGTTAAPATIQQYVAQILAEQQSVNGLGTCIPYQNWLVTWKTESNSDAEFIAKIASIPPAGDNSPSAIAHKLQTIYFDLLTSMLKDATCKPALDNFPAMFEAILEAKTYEDIASQQKASKKPELALEYDLNTPQDKPSYSSVKGTLTKSFLSPNKKPASPSASSATLDPLQAALRANVKSAVTSSAAMGSGVVQTRKTGAAAGTKSIAEATVSPLSLTLNGSADIYNAQPSSAVPSASRMRDIQAGAELSYLFAPPANGSALRTFLGDVTVAGAYSYQDQTSPAILTGPALSDFTGLPSSTTTVYAKRGVIHLGQLKIGFGTGTNINFPLAFTYSNRTELVVHPTWGLQFGISYNLTSLLTSAASSSTANATAKAAAAAPTP
jgi:hypothetical protein